MAKRHRRGRNGNIVFKFIIVDNRGISANDELSRAAINKEGPVHSRILLAMNK